jgi:hypothetical protein
MRLTIPVHGKDMNPGLENAHEALENHIMI